MQMYYRVELFTSAMAFPAGSFAYCFSLFIYQREPFFFHLFLYFEHAKIRNKGRWNVKFNCYFYQLPLSTLHPIILLHKSHNLDGTCSRFYIRNSRKPFSHAGCYLSYRSGIPALRVLVLGLIRRTTWSISS